MPTMPAPQWTVLQTTRVGGSLFEVWVKQTKRVTSWMIRQGPVIGG